MSGEHSVQTLFINWYPLLHTSATTPLEQVTVVLVLH